MYQSSFTPAPLFLQIFPRRELNFTSESICNWVFEHHEDVLRWLQPPGTKSRLLERELTKGPALLLFLPYDPLGSASDLLQQVSGAGGNRPPEGRHQTSCGFLLSQVGDIAVRYHSCENDGSSPGGSGASGSSCCQSFPLPESGGGVCEVCLSTPGSSSCSSLPFVVQAPLGRCCLQGEDAPRCSDSRGNYSPFSRFRACCRRADPRRNRSEAKEVADRRRSAPAPRTSITGLRCQTNRTLRFYVLDVALNWPLAVRLGAAEGSRNASLTPQGAHGPFAAIVDLKDEVHYVLHRSPLSTLTESLGKRERAWPLGLRRSGFTVFATLVEAFIRNFSAPYSLLQRHLVGEGDRRGGDGDGDGDSEPPDEHQPSPPAPPRPLITELTTTSFLPHVMDVQKVRRCLSRGRQSRAAPSQRVLFLLQDVLLFYYTQWCGFCSALNHVVIQLARLLQGNGAIAVARLVHPNDARRTFNRDPLSNVLVCVLKTG